MKWDFKHRPDREYQWEAYYSPMGAEVFDIYGWCYKTFGPVGQRWDNHGGWVKFRNEEDVTLFLLRWS